MGTFITENIKNLALIFILILTTTFLNDIIFNMKEEQMNSYFYSVFLYFSALIHESCHFIVAKIFGFTVYDFKVKSAKELRNTDDFEQGNVVVNIIPFFENKIGMFLVSLAPLLFSYLIYLAFSDINLTETITSIELSIDTLKTIFLANGFSKFFKIIPVLALFTFVLTNISSLSLEDIANMRKSSFQMFVFILVTSFFEIALSPLFSHLNLDNYILYLLIVLASISIFQAFDLRLLKILAITALSLLLSVYWTSILATFLAFLVFFLIALIFNLIFTIFKKIIYNVIKPTDLSDTKEEEI